MPEFLVQFDRPVWYQPDHPIAKRETQAICVSAPHEKDAEKHAIRVTRGAGEVLKVYPIAEAPEPLVTIARSGFTLPLYTDPATGLRTAIPPETSGLVVHVDPNV